MGYGLFVVGVGAEEHGLEDFLEQFARSGELR